MVVVSSLSCVWLFVNPWTVAHQAPLSMGFAGKNTEVGCHFLLRGIFPTQGWNPYLLHCRQIYYSWASREAQEIYKVTSKRHESNCWGIWVEGEADPPTGDLSRVGVDPRGSEQSGKQAFCGPEQSGKRPPWAWDPGTGLICIWVLVTLTCSVILAGFLKVPKSQLCQLPQNLVSWTQRAQSGHRERLLLTKSSNLVQWKVDF